MELHEKKCIPCESGGNPLSEDEAKKNLVNAIGMLKSESREMSSHAHEIIILKSILRNYERSKLILICDQLFSNYCNEKMMDQLVPALMSVVKYFIESDTSSEKIKAWINAWREFESKHKVSLPEIIFKLYESCLRYVESNKDYKELLSLPQEFRTALFEENGAMKVKKVPS